MSSRGATSPVLTRQSGRKYTVTLNRPAALNALNGEMVEILLQTYTQLHQAKDIVVVMKGAGGKAFCAGGDVVSLAKDIPRGTQKEFFYREYQLDNLVASCPHPHIAIWDGIVMGGGVGVSVHGGFRVATEATKFAMPETGIGLFPDVGGSWFLPRLPHEGMGMFLALSGHRLSGKDTVHAGIATHFVPKEKLEGMDADLATLTVPADAAGVVAKHATDLGEFSLGPHLDQIARIFGRDAVDVEDIVAKLNADGSDWAKKLVAAFAKFSPTSMKISFEAQRRAARMKSIEEAFAMEYLMTQRCMAGHDFKAGVTALLIDKTGKPPVWSPPTLEGVTPSIVAEHFARVSADQPAWRPTGEFPGKEGAGESCKL